MNNKGLTLVELIFSLAITSIIMIFIMSLLSDLKREDSLSKSQSEDALTRSNVVSLIQNDFINYGVKKIENTSSTTYPKLKITFNDGTIKELTINQDSIIYGQMNNLEIWHLNETKFASEGYKYCLKTSSQNANIANTNDYYYMLSIKIPVDANLNYRRKYDFDLITMGYGKINVNLSGMTLDCN